MQYVRPCFNPRNADEVMYGTCGPTSTGVSIRWRNLRTGQEHEIVPQSVDWFLQPKWGATGWIAFTGGNQQVWKVKANGDSLTQLTFGVSHREPQWSPDGRQLAVSYSSSRDENVVILDLQGRELQKLVLPGDEAWPMAWSPDGTKLIVQVLGDPGSEAGIYVYDLGTKQSSLLMDGQAPLASGPQPQFLHWFDWLPDNRTLIWAGSKGLFRTDTQTKKTTMLHKGCESRVYLSPSVSADGRTIVVGRIDYEVKGSPEALYADYGLVLMDPDGRNERKVVF